MRTFKAAIIYWRLAIFRVSGKAVIAMVLSAAQALNGVEWSTFTATQKFICIALAVGSGWSIIDAFIDQTLSRIQDDPDGLGIPRGEGKVTQETRSASVTNTVVEPKP